MKDPAEVGIKGLDMLRVEAIDATRAWGAEALFRAHGPFVAAFLARMGVTAGDIDDAVQEVFLVVHRKGGYEPGPAQPRSWLAAIAVHIARAARRQHQRQPIAAVEQLDHTMCKQPDPATRLETQLDLVRVQGALDQLPLELRAAFVLYEIEGESCESIAATWSIPIGTVYSRLHNARRRFMRAYATAAAADEDAGGLANLDCGKTLEARASR